MLKLDTLLLLYHRILMYLSAENNRVQCLKKTGKFSHIIGAGKKGQGKGELDNPTDTVVDSQGN